MALMGSSGISWKAVTKVNSVLVCRVSANTGSLDETLDPKLQCLGDTHLSHARLRRENEDEGKGL